MSGYKYNFRSVEDEKKKLVWSGTNFEQEAAENPDVARKVLLDLVESATQRDEDKRTRPRYDPRHHGGKET